MNDLNEIQVFTYVAQLGSFSQAARALGMPVSTVSRKVSELEKRLGVTLLLRTTRKLKLTSQGQEFSESCSGYIRGIEEAQARASQKKTEAEGLLKITAPIAMGQSHFIQFISDFMKDHPKIKIDLTLTNQYLDLISAGVDVAIRFGALEDSSIMAKKLGTTRRYLVASPSYLEKTEKIRGVQDLGRHSCVLFGGRQAESAWELVSGKSRARVKVSGNICCSDLNTAYAFTLSGHGIALLPESFCHEAIKTKKLVAVLPGWSSPTIPVHAIYLKRQFRPKRIETFLNNLAAWKNPYWS